MNQTLQKMNSGSKKSLFTRHKGKLIALAAFSLCVDFLGSALFITGNFPGAETLIGGYFLVRVNSIRRLRPSIGFV